MEEKKRTKWIILDTERANELGIWLQDDVLCFESKNLDINPFIENLIKEGIIKAL